MSYYDFVYFNMSMLKANHALTIYHWSVCELKRRRSLQLHHLNNSRNKILLVECIKRLSLNNFQVQKEQRIRKKGQK